MFCAPKNKEGKREKERKTFLAAKEDIPCSTTVDDVEEG